MSTEKKKHRSVQEHALIGTAAGATSGVLSAIATHPLDTLKTNEQTSRTNATLKQLLGSYTAPGAWKGLRSSALKKGIGFGVGFGGGFLVEGTIKKLLEKLRANDNS